jgi:hypothetical protein
MYGTLLIINSTVWHQVSERLSALESCLTSNPLAPTFSVVCVASRLKEKRPSTANTHYLRMNKITEKNCINSQVEVFPFLRLSKLRELKKDAFLTPVKKMQPRNFDEIVN